MWAIIVAGNIVGMFNNQAECMNMARLEPGVVCKQAYPAPDGVGYCATTTPGQMVCQSTSQSPIYIGKPKQ